MQEFSKKPGKFPLRERRGTYNSAKSIAPIHYYQDQRGKAEQMMNFVLKGAQEGLIMTATPQDCVVHWPGSFLAERTQLNSCYEELIYQEGKSLDYLSTEVINSKEEEPASKREKYKRRTIHMAEVTELLTPLEISDIYLSDESEANITPEEKIDGESEEHK